MELSLKDYFVSDTHGFIIEEPLTALPDNFEPWNQLATDMAELVAAGTMRQRVLQMPLLDWRRLEGHRQKRLSHLQLTIIASGYVWQNGDKGVCKILPACVAIPLYGVSQDLGLPPVICHADLALANYTTIDPNKPLELENMKALYYMPGGEESEWFALVTAGVELTFAKGIKSILSALEGVDSGDETVVTSSLVHLTEVVNNMQKTLSRMHEKVSAETFFNKLRPFLNGWGGENSPLPDGLIYEGVSDQPIHAIGGSGAQSAVMQTLDALMGVQHSTEKTAYLMCTRGYMPFAHRQFIEAIEQWPNSLFKMVHGSSDGKLRQAYDNLLSAMVDFRSYHIQIVTKYIVLPSSKKKQDEDKSFESVSKKGTGGTNILPFLKEIRSDTKDQMTSTRAVTNGKQ